MSDTAFIGWQIMFALLLLLSIQATIMYGLKDIAKAIREKRP